jgi:hypothetical protein
MRLRKKVLSAENPTRRLAVLSRALLVSLIFASDEASDDEDHAPRGKTFSPRVETFSLAARVCPRADLTAAWLPE